MEYWPQRCEFRFLDMRRGLFAEQAAEGFQREVDRRLRALGRQLPGNEPPTNPISILVVERKGMEVNVLQSRALVQNIFVRREAEALAVGEQGNFREQSHWNFEDGALFPSRAAPDRNG